MDKKLTDNLSNNSPILSNGLSDSEIVKALECFAIDKDFDETHCIGCAFEHQFCTANMSEDIAKSALSLINRQKAEIERLEEEIKKEQLYNLRMTAHSVKVEAYKEFAELVKDKAYTYSDITGYQSTVVDVCEIDGVYEELVGEDQ